MALMEEPVDSKFFGKLCTKVFSKSDLLNKTIVRQNKFITKECLDENRLQYIYIW